MRLSAFVNRHREVFAERQLEDVAVVVPQSQIYSVRDFGTAATQRAVQTFEYELHAPVRMVAEDDVAGFARLPGVRPAGSASVQIPAERAVLALVDRKTGQLLHSTYTGLKACADR